MMRSSVALIGIVVGRSFHTIRENARTAVASAENAVSQQQQSLLAAEASLAQARQAVNTAQTSVDREQVALETARRELEDLCRAVRQAMGSGDKDKMEEASASLNDAP